MSTGAPARIDLHCHLAPPEYLARIPTAIRNALPTWSFQQLSSDMERFEIDAAVLSVGPPGVHFGDSDEAAGLARWVNEWAADLIRREPRRFGALASLPLPDVDKALAEVTYALDELQLDGVVLYTNHAGIYLGDDRFEPLLEELDRRGTYVFVHPGWPPNEQPLPQHPAWLYEFPFDTTRCITNLVYSGALDRHRNIRFQFAHLGGTALFLADRLASLADREPELAAGASERFTDYLRNFYYDTGLCNHVEPIQAASARSAPGRVGFGSDFPYAHLPAEGNDPVPGLAHLGETHLIGLFSDAARDLVPRLGATHES